MHDICLATWIRQFARCRVVRDPVRIAHTIAAKLTLASITLGTVAYIIIAVSLSVATAVAIRVATVYGLTLSEVETEVNLTWMWRIIKCWLKMGYVPLEVSPVW